MPSRSSCNDARPVHRHVLAALDGPARRRGDAPRIDGKPPVGSMARCAVAEQVGETLAGQRARWARPPRRSNAIRARRLPRCASRTRAADATGCTRRGTSRRVERLAGRDGREARRRMAARRRASRQQEICDALAQTTRDLAALASTFEQRSSELLSTIRDSHTGLQTQLAARDEERLSAWNDSLAAMATKLGDEWQRAGVLVRAVSRKSATHWRKRRAISRRRLRRSNNARTRCCRRSAIRTRACRRNWLHATRNASLRGTTRWSRWPRNWVTNGSAQACQRRPSAGNATHWRKRRAT